VAEQANLRKIVIGQDCRHTMIALAEHHDARGRARHDVASKPIVVSKQG
jgi:hypothetical protein